VLSFLRSFGDEIIVTAFLFCCQFVVVVCEPKTKLFLQLADVFFADLPRIRLDRRPRSRKTIWEPQPTLHEEVEDENAYNNASNIELNTTLQSCLGELRLNWIHIQ